MNQMVKAETALQIALVLPIAAFVGWAAGAGLDHWLHTQWLFMVGIVVGSAAGFYQMFRIAKQLLRSTE